MKSINNFIFEKLHINANIKISNNINKLLDSLNEYFSTAFKEDMEKIIEYLKKWINTVDAVDFKILVPDYDKDFVSKYLVNWDINKYIEWVNYDKFDDFRSDNIPNGLETAVYNKEYQKKKYISLQLCEKAAYIETYDLSILIVPKEIEIK